MKHFVWVLAVFMMAGCGRERIVNIATEDEMEDKALLMIFPSVPEEFCYADRMAEILNDFAENLNGTNSQVLSVQANIDCSNYGFHTCTNDSIEQDDGKVIEFEECISDEQSKLCLFVKGNEYKDVEGNLFDETCVMGIDK